MGFLLESRIEQDLRAFTKGVSFALFWNKMALLMCENGIC